MVLLAIVDNRLFSKIFNAQRSIKGYLSWKEDFLNIHAFVQGSLRRSSHPLARIVADLLRITPEHRMTDRELEKELLLLQKRPL